ncbi:zinc-dependent alcohol dehydrogenase family protein [Paenibacillus sp. Soil724D2]|uniref:zinc-dependent alcohol dehydrogenase family protein n=1 Tax=Paenibacillus sp. (strain Soil724D2) TaxID=1736392 RepID=UPI0007146700|nr:NAD(P)-dependent alcohol dehydrogenase [Paenibacillus sp. Soil724D2]KRE50157.1 NADPH:quinone oxidoreductase [Paenibacillus sp. Soil724D2]
MKAIQLTNGFGFEELNITELDIPTPGPHEVLIRMKAASLNYRDLVILSGLMPIEIKFPFIPLSDGAGEIVAVGQGVTRFQVGNRVAGNLQQRFMAGSPRAEVLRDSLGGPLNGVAAEYVVLHEDGIVHIPDHLTWEEAATLPIAALTAWSMLIEYGGLQAGDTVLLQGTGGVSIFGLQFALMAGARAIITSSSNDKLERAKALGAWQTINYSEVPDWDIAVLELTGGVDHVLDVGGAATMTKSINALRIGGTLSMVGFLSGLTIPEYDVTGILQKAATVRGSQVGNRDHFEKMNRAIAHHRLHPVVDRVFPLDRVGEAFALLAEGKQYFGKIVVQI